MHLRQFSLLGYRTLVFAERYLNNEQMNIVEEKYQKAIQSTNRKEEMEKLANFLERDLTLLGCTIVEDSLQDGVKDIIGKALEADIKVWMITGDKLETAQNIGSMAGILNEEMKILYIDDLDYGTDILETCYKVYAGLQTAKDDGIKSGLIIDMRAIESVLHEYSKIQNSGKKIKELPAKINKRIDILQKILLTSDAVICARSTPM